MIQFLVFTLPTNRHQSETWVNLYLDTEPNFLLLQTVFSDCLNYIPIMPLFLISVIEDVKIQFFLFNIFGIYS